MDERMLLLSLRRNGQSLTVRQLLIHWEPTWTEEQIQLMLTMLVQSGEVVKEEGVVVRYRANHPAGADIRVSFLRNRPEECNSAAATIIPMARNSLGGMFQ